MQKEKPDYISLNTIVLRIIMKLICQRIAVITIAFLIVKVTQEIWEKNKWASCGFVIFLIFCLSFLLPGMRDLVKEAKGKFSYVKAKLGFQEGEKDETNNCIWCFVAWGYSARKYDSCIGADRPLYKIKTSRGKNVKNLALPRSSCDDGNLWMHDCSFPDCNILLKSPKRRT